MSRNNSLNNSMIDLSTSSGNSKNKKIVDKELMKTLCVKKEEKDKKLGANNPEDKYN